MGGFYCNLNRMGKYYLWGVSVSYVTVVIGQK